LFSQKLRRALENLENKNAAEESTGTLPLQVMTTVLLPVQVPGPKLKLQ
jgi:hypothetical protein